MTEPEKVLFSEIIEDINEEVLQNTELEVKKDLSDIDHDEMVKITKDAIRNIIESDPLFSGLPPDPTIEEIRAEIAVAQGQAIVVYLDRGPLSRLSIVVPPKGTTILELKKAIKRHTNLTLKREKINRKISWKHVWKKYNLCYDDIVLADDNEDIENYGICNKSVLKYKKKRRHKNSTKNH